MQDDFNPALDEIVSRILVRDDEQACSDRPIRDEDDFLRRIAYGPKKRPENGLSLFRRRVPTQEIFGRLCSRKRGGEIIFIPMFLGLSSIRFEVLAKAHFQHHSTPENPEHVSLRCC